jgi:hypothetical protein
MKRQSRVKSSRAIAVRSLRINSNRTKEIVVSIGKPIEEAPNLWACGFWFVQNGKKVDRQTARGVDGVQALLMALEGIRTTLKKLGYSYSWLGGEGQSGFPALVPIYFGPEFEKELSDFIDRSVIEKSASLTSTVRSPRRPKR